MKCHEIKAGKKYTDGSNIREVAELKSLRNDMGIQVRYQFTHKGYERGRGKQGLFYTCRLQTFASWAKNEC